MGFLQLLVVLLIVAFITLLSRVLYRLIRAAITGGDTRTPEEILEERYARGEIDADELDERRRKLHHH